MSQALYRKYRSRKLSEIVGQEHITQTLKNAIKNGKISHAYLFTGPRGVGKTSIARILAHEINNIPYEDDSMHLDIIEIDAASNRRIDEIRDLRDKVHITPTSAKYKVYIIDEVHMLTKEAFNALLKTLEEPPKHVVFILATTEIHKLPDTIVSRTQRFTFKAIDNSEAVEHLAQIAKSENITIDKQALEILAIHGNGSFRDSISLLDQVSSSSSSITTQDVERLIGLAPAEHIDAILDAVTNGTAMDIVASLDKLTEDGVNPSQIAKQLSASIRPLIISGSLDQIGLKLLSELLAVNSSPEPIASLEISLLAANLALNPYMSKSIAFAQSTLQTQNNQSSTPDTTSIVDKTPEPNINQEQIKEKPAVVDQIPAQKLEISTDSIDWWDDVLKHIKANNNTLHGMLRMADIQLKGQELSLIFKFAFHKNKLTDPGTLAKLTEAIQKVTGQTLSIKPIHNNGSVVTQPRSDQVDTNKESGTVDKPQNNQGQANDLSAITNIFGGGEVLES